MKPIAVFDTEIYRDYFLVAFKNLATGNIATFERTPGQDLDVDRVQKILANYTVIGFNSNHFDMPVLAMALTGADNAKIKQVCDAIITGGMKAWAIYKEFGLVQIEADHIDLIEVAPGMIGLKQYAGRLHAPSLVDLPLPPDASISVEQRAVLREYCANDLSLTEQLYNHLLPQIDLRRDMTQQYGIDLRSKSDAQIAEAVIKAEVEKLNGGKRLTRTELKPGTTLAYEAPAWVSFQTGTLRTVFDMINSAVFTVDQWGSPMMPEQMENMNFSLHPSTYRLGIGGLHSSETTAAHHTDDEFILVDRDVASYYPSLILGMGLAPANMGKHFLEVYASIVARRLAAKHAGDKVTADALKICVNGSFGKLGSKWSVLYAPHLMLQVTLTGQLALLMLIEMLHLEGIDVVSANTDGVVIKCRRSKVAEMDAIVDWWEHTTGLVTEATDYRAIYSRDVNNYIAIKPDGKAKCKGAYAGTSLAKSPANEVCNEAAIAYLTSGRSVASTINECRDIRKFVTLRQVKGGAVWNGQHLGRVVRWYYGTAGASIHYVTNGNKVAKSDGAVPCMALPDTVPGDINYEWYINEAEQILADIGAKHHDTRTEKSRCDDLPLLCDTASA